MLRLQWVEIFLRIIPEMLLITWGIYEIARKSINLKILIAFSFVMGLIGFFVRMLPIYLGIHTFIMVILIICVITVVGIPLIKAIYGTMVMFLLLSFSEYLNLLILKCLNLNTNIQTLNPVVKSVDGIPSLAILCLSVILIRFFRKRKGMIIC